jgi:hypothetical protein
MPKYRSGFSEQDFVRLKTAIENIGEEGPFSANDVLPLVVAAGITNNAGDVAAMLGDLEDLEYLQALGGSPPRWQKAE